jgi:hypothetical protein
LLALTEAGTYACHVDARSTACRTAPNHSTEDGTTCSWSVRGDFTGQTRGLPVTARLCNPGPGVGAFVVTLDGVGSYEAPGSLFLNDDGVLAQLSFDAGDRHVSLSLRIPFLCAEQNPAAPVVTGQIWVD